MSATPPSSVLTIARAYVAAGLSVIPVGLDGRKQPAFDVLPRGPDPDRDDRTKATWKPFESRRADDEELVRWFGGSKPYGIALACGASSGGAECLDFDDKDTAREFCRIVRGEAPALYESLSLESTPRGLHVWYTTAAGEGNRGLAGRPDGFDGKGRPKTKKTIETRGQGGYAIVAGSPLAVHELKLPYEYVTGPPLTALVRITDEDRDYLFRLAMSFDQEDRRTAENRERVYRSDELSPGDDYDLRGELFCQLLPEAVFSCNSEDKGNVCRPGKERGNSATVGRCRGSRGEPLLKVFTSNWEPFEAGKCYGRFQVLRLIRFGGDGAAATKYLADRSFGSPDRSSRGDPGASTAGGAGAREAGEPPATPRFRFIDSAEFLKGDYRPRWLVPRILVRGQPGVIAGPSKGMKTSLLIDLAVSLACAHPFLGTFPVRERVRVAVVSGESGEHTLKETCLRVLAAKELDADLLDGWLKWEFTLPTFSDLASMQAFGEALARIEADVVVIDPTYLALGEVDAKNLFEMGRALKNVAAILRKLRPDLTVILVHHANRLLPVGEVMELQHLAYSGLEQFARQFILLNRREPYRNDGEHELWVRVGGSAGHGGLWAVHVSEGLVAEDFTGRRWGITVAPFEQAQAAARTDAEAQRRDERLERLQADERAVLLAIDAEVARGQEGATVRRIRDATAFSYDRASDALARLREQGAVEPCEWSKNDFGNGATRAVKGWRRKPD